MLGSKWPPNKRKTPLLILITENFLRTIYETSSSHYILSLEVVWELVRRLRVHTSKYLLREQIRRSSFLAMALMLARVGWSFVPCSARTAPERCASSGLWTVRVLGSPNPNRIP